MTLSSPWRLNALAAVTALSVLGAGMVASTSAQAETIVGLTSTNALVSFDSATPAQASAAVSITGLTGLNETILGIDLRPATGALYGLGSGGNLYTLNALTGAATFVSTLMADPADGTNPFSGLSGSSFGVDFNPTVDRLRITSDSGQNLRTNVTTGNVTTDGPLNSATTSISASAYTNNDNDPATGTTLYGISSVTGMLYTQAPPNDGTQTAVGSLGFSTTGSAGFDISGATGIAYASLTDGVTGKSALYTINLATGAATFAGAFGIGGNTALAPSLLGIAVTAVPEPETYAMLAAGLLVIGAVARRRKSRR